MCHVAHVRCQASCIRCQLSCVKTATAIDPPKVCQKKIIQTAQKLFQYLRYAL